MADSTASEPLLVKKTRFRSPGASEAIRVASSIARGMGVAPDGDEVELADLRRHRVAELGSGRAPS